MRTVYITLGLSILILFSCKGDQNTIQVEPKIETTDMVGTWKMHEAYKGNSKTKLLDNAYFIFDNNGKIVSNIQGDAQSYPYSFTKNKLSIDNPSKDVYKVLSMTSDTLILTTKIRNFDFKFITVKSKSEE